MQEFPDSLDIGKSDVTTMMIQPATLLLALDPQVDGPEFLAADPQRDTLAPVDTDRIGPANVRRLQSSNHHLVTAANYPGTLADYAAALVRDNTEVRSY